MLNGLNGRLRRLPRAPRQSTVLRNHPVSSGYSSYPLGLKCHYHPPSVEDTGISCSPSVGFGPFGHACLLEIRVSGPLERSTLRRSRDRRRGRGMSIRLVGGLSGLSGRMRGVLSACGRGGLPGVAHRGGGFWRDAALSRTAGSGPRRGPPAAGQRSAGWRGAGRRSGPRGARRRWPR